MTELERRIDVIEQLKEFHSSIVQDINSNIAHYTGGFKDSGSLRMDYCIFKATVRELEETLGEALGGNRQKELEDIERKKRFDRALEACGGPTDSGGNDMASRFRDKVADIFKVREYRMITGDNNG